MGDILTIRAPGARSAELAVVESEGARSLARVIQLDGDMAALQVFRGGRGISTRARVRFLGHPMQVPCSRNLFGRILDGAGVPRDGGPGLEDERTIPIASPTVNPVRRTQPDRMIRTDVPMIDVFNTIVESQKIPIFTVAGEPHAKLISRIGVQADADLIVFGGLGLIYDDFHFYRSAFEEAGVFGRTVMFVNLASDPVVERLLVPDLALAVAEDFALRESLRVLVLLTDMTAFADSLKEIGVALEHVPSNRGYPGDLYSQLARRYEKAVSFQGAGSVTVLAVTTMPGNDVTHPVPDNTGYITEGQIYLHHSVIDPFGSLSRLKQHVVGKQTREDHGQLANAMIRLYAAAQDAERKHAMAFELTDFDQRALAYGRHFTDRFMQVDVRLPLEAALDLGWRTLAESFAPEELLIKQALVDKYYPGSDTRPDA